MFIQLAKYCTIGEQFFEMLWYNNRVAVVFWFNFTISFLFFVFVLRFDLVLHGSIFCVIFGFFLFLLLIILVCINQINALFTVPDQMSSTPSFLLIQPCCLIGHAVNWSIDVSHMHGFYHFDSFSLFFLGNNFTFCFSSGLIFVNVSCHYFYYTI